MKVIRAAAAGACYGVQRALDMAYRASEEHADVKSLGPLIHNPQVVADLESKGIEVVHYVTPGQKGTVIVRSHGVGPEMRGMLESSQATVVDATCPHVLRAQKAAQKLAREIGAVVVVGDPEHPEVEAIRDYALLGGARVWVVDSADEVPDDLPDTVGIVIQTTQNRAVFDQILERIQRAGVNTAVKDTICESTSKRQQAARELAANVDAMVVIGGHNSSNTTRLYEICKALCDKTYHIETVGELDPASFADCQSVGITAGASTPEAQIVSVEAYLERL